MRRIRLLALVAVLAGLALFVAPARDGRPMLDFASVKGRLTGAVGGAAAEPEAPRGDEPRSAAELLAESKRLGEKTEARETELQKALRDAQSRLRGLSRG